MFRMSSFSESKIMGTIEVDKPIKCLGKVTDIYGNTWDIRSIFRSHVNACLVKDLHPYFALTASDNFSFVSQTWYPYTVKVVKNSGQTKRA